MVWKECKTYRVRMAPSPPSPVHYRVKFRPEDFVVEEITDLRVKRRGQYRVYRLTKSGWNTVDALLRIGKRTHTNLADFSFGGRKDRHARTVQYVTVLGKRSLEFHDRDLSFEPVGFSDDRMGPRRIRANAFSITVRDLDSRGADAIVGNLPIVGRQGLPNYFDDQRFGSGDPARGFVGEWLMKGDWPRALEVHLTSVREEDGPAERARRSFFLEHWKDWTRCRERAETVTERRIFEHLAQRGRHSPNAWIEAVNMIPREEIAFALSAWQSCLWNRMAVRAVRDVTDDLVSVHGAAGEYLFYLGLEPEAYAILRKISIPMPGPRPQIADLRTAEIYERIVNQAGLDDRSFRLGQLRGSYMKSFPRDLLLRAEDLLVTDRKPDELYPGRERLRISFRVGRGSYGTMVIKRLALDMA
jgi:tRNA pseudouridine13 synthase